jgi:hypothetical protein
MALGVDHRPVELAALRATSRGAKGADHLAKPLVRWGLSPRGESNS